MMKSRHRLFFRAVPKKCGAKVPQNWISELKKLMKLMKLSSRKRVPFDTGLATFREKKRSTLFQKAKRDHLRPWFLAFKFISVRFWGWRFFANVFPHFFHFLLWKFPKNFPTRLLQREQWTLVVGGSKHFIHGMEGSGKDLQCRQTWNMKKKHRAENYKQFLRSPLPSSHQKASHQVTQKQKFSQMVMSNLQLQWFIMVRT